MHIPVVYYIAIVNIALIRQSTKYWLLLTMFDRPLLRCCYGIKCYRYPYMVNILDTSHMPLKLGETHCSMVHTSKLTAAKHALILKQNCFHITVNGPAHARISLEFLSSLYTGRILCLILSLYLYHAWP